MNKEVGKFIVYLKGGHSFKVKAKGIDLKWDNDGNVTYYNFTWPTPQDMKFAFPPQSIVGIRRIR